MALSGARVTVATSPTVIASNPADTLSGLDVIARIPAGAATVYIGDSAVTASDGFPLSAGEQFNITLRRSESPYAAVASGSQVVQVLRAAPGEVVA